MFTKEQKTVISIVLGALAIVTFVCLYGFTIGGEFFSFKYLIYCLFTSFIMTSSAFLFIFKKEEMKGWFAKEPYVIVLLIVAALQLLIYQPLNLLSASDNGEEYEVEITDCSNVRLSSTVCFIDKDGVERSKDISFKYIITDDDELYPQIGGRMMVKETTGGFNCKYFEIIKVTYMPEQ